jgi:cell division protein FtsL
MTRRRTNAAAADRQHALFWLVAAAVVYVGVALSGVWIASLGQDVRGLFVALEQNQRTQDALLAQYSRLLIERSTLSSYQNVDQVAEQQLTMRFPEIVERVAP